MPEALKFFENITKVKLPPFIEKLVNGNLSGIKQNNKIHKINLKEVNEDNLLDEDYGEENGDSNININVTKKQKINLKYTELLDTIKNRDLDEFLYINEYLCNFLLMPSEIEISNKIVALSLISYFYQKTEKTHLIYNIF